MDRYVESLKPKPVPDKRILTVKLKDPITDVERNRIAAAIQQMRHVVLVSPVRITRTILEEK